MGLMRNGGSVDVFFHGWYGYFCMVGIFVLWHVAAILWNGCRFKGESPVSWLQGSKMPLGFHYKNLMLGV